MTLTPKTEQFRSGFVGMAGVPNAGKSSLVNRLVGQKVSIVSRCPQTTRHRVCGILTDETTQAVLVDIPGVLSTGNKFNQTLVDTAGEALRNCDLILHLRTAATAADPDETHLISLLKDIRRPIWQVWNKIDLKAQRPREESLSLPLPYEATYFISAKTGEGVSALLEGLRHRLPPGPMLYPEDDISDRDLRFLAAEMVREKAFLFLQQEVPYGIATWTEIWEDRPGRNAYVRVVIQTEREAHKSIIIGAGGKVLKKIGESARRDIEELCGHPIFLELWVQVKPRWRDHPGELNRLGMS